MAPIPEQAPSISPIAAVTVIDSGYCRPHLAAVYLLSDRGDLAIIETATSPAAGRIMQALKERGFVPEQVRYIIPTHVHLDHAGGAGTLLQYCPNAKLLVHPKGARHMIDPSQLLAGTVQIYGQQKTRELYGTVIPVDRSRVRCMEDGEQVMLGHLTLQFINTPGHAFHHFCIHVPELVTLFSGDTLGIAYPELQLEHNRFIYASTTPVQFQPQLLLTSIDRLQSLKAKWVALTHFGLHRLDDVYFQQLRLSVASHRDIALACHNTAATSPLSREQLIAERLQKYFRHTLDSDLSEAEFSALLGNDIRLNAMGLETWLQRQSPPIDSIK